MNDSGYMSSKKNILRTYLTLIFLFFTGVIIILLSNNYFGGGDTFQHYNLAHWGWKYPKLLFDHWGKPVFTILISPLAQFGFKGAQITNLIFGFLTSLVIWKISRLLNLKYANLSPFLVIAIPIYVPLMFSSLTEVSFSFFISLSILLFLRKNYIASAIFISLLPLIRTESIVLIPLFFVAFILKRKYLHILLFTTGFWIISFFGREYYNGDFFWLINAMPYKGDAVSIYGSGTWYHFIWNSRERAPIISEIVGVLFIIGIILKITEWIKKDKFRFTDNFFMLWLIAGSYIIFFAAHSFVWWQGMGNSLGLQRVIGSVTPLVVIPSIAGIQYIMQLLKKVNERNKFVLGYLIVALIFITGIMDYHRSFSPSATQKIQQKASDYILENNLQKNKIFYFSPFLIFKTGIDPYDIKSCQSSLENYEYPSRGIPDSSIIVWDAHFGPNEGRLAFENLENDPALAKLATFRPEKPFTVLGGYDYRVIIYQKQLSLVDTLYNSILLDFEAGDNSSSENQSFKGKYSKHITKRDPYIPGIIAYLDEVIDSASEFNVSFSGYYYIEDTTDLELNLVVNVLDGRDSEFYSVKKLVNSEIIPGQWNKISSSVQVSKPANLNKLIKVFLWNKNKKEFYLDDLKFNISNKLLQKTYYKDLQKLPADSLIKINEFSEGLSITINELVEYTPYDIHLSGYIYLQSKTDKEISLVCSVYGSETSGYYDYYNLTGEGIEEKEWYFFDHTFNIDTLAASNDILKVYIWNKHFQDVAISDLNIRIVPEK